MKFLYGVNSETRKLIKRSSRKEELEERFKIEEMSSISTLEFAWEHYPWGTYVRELKEDMDEEYFCEQVAATNNNSSCSSGRERRKSVIGIIGRLIWPQTKVIWKW